MTGIPAKASFTGGSVTQGQFKTTLDQLIDALDERLVNGATPIQTDTINEASVGAGVTLDGLLVKDGEVHLDLGGAKTVKLLNLSAADYGKLLQVAPDGAALEAIGPSHGFRNKVINGDFQIWQRGASCSGVNASFHSADRWRHYLGTGDSAVGTRMGFAPGQTDVPGEPQFYLSLEKTATANSVQLIHHKVEDVRTLAGQTVTMSYHAKTNAALAPVAITARQDFGVGGSAYAQQNLSPNPTYTTSWVKYTHTFTLGSIAGKTIGSSSYLDLFWTMPNALFTIDIANVQLELGDAATPFEQRPIAAELALCERFYAKSYQQGMPPGTSTQAGCFNFVAVNSGIKDRWTIQLPTTMRVIPTMTMYSRIGTAGYIYDEDAAADIAVGTHEVADRSFALYASGSFTAGNQMNVHWVADAEL